MQWTDVGVSGGCIRDVYEEGDTLVAVQFLHKFWPSSCNAFGDAREDALRVARETAGKGGEGEVGDGVVISFRSLSSFLSIPFYSFHSFLLPSLNPLPHHLSLLTS